MKHFIVFFMAVIFNGSAAAGWTQIGDEVVKELGVDTGRGTKTFVLKDGIDKIGDRSIMWTLRDYENPAKVGRKNHYSSRSLEEYDCKEMQYKTLSYYWYSKHNGEGDVVYADISHGDMQPIIPNSLVHDAWKIACGK